jgi:DNA-binding response OmpR family regulator
MSRVLVVEDSVVFSSLVKKEIESKLGMTVTLTKSYAETEKLLSDMEEDNFFSEDNFFIAVLDLNLPDAASGKIVDLIRSKSMPAIVFTGESDDKIRELMLSKEIVDYVYKRGRSDIQYLVSLIKRIHTNQFINILVADDSAVFRAKMCALLELHQYKVIQAGDGIEALRKLQEHPDIALVITDYEMPKMDGFALTQKIREKHEKNEVAIIGVSSRGGDQGFSARFLKNGANDFITKPFIAEEFYCRVAQNVENIENCRRLKQVESELLRCKEAAAANLNKS